MRLRRPHYLVFEPRERIADSLLYRIRGDGQGAAIDWVAIAPHLGREERVLAPDLALFGVLAPGEEAERSAWEARFGADCVGRLADAGLLIGDHPAHAWLRQRDAQLREAAWWGPAAIAQVFGRWEGVDVAAIEREEGPRGANRLLLARGAPPPAALETGGADARVPLPSPRPSALGDCLAARVTCRHFDPVAPLAAADFATVMHRAFAALAEIELAPGASMLKKASPSGGGLHPIEAFVLVRRVEGLSPGLYHYHCRAHALEPLASPHGAALDAVAGELVAGQPWFAEAPVLVLMAARFPRQHWKYPRHPKAWKVVQLDAGHLSQTLCLAATEAGLGAFVTAAINDACAERVFGLDGLDIGPVAVCGFGPRSPAAAREGFDFRHGTAGTTAGAGPAAPGDAEPA